MSRKAFQMAVVLAVLFSAFPATVLSTNVSLPSTGPPAQMDTPLLIRGIHAIHGAPGNGQRLGRFSLGQQLPRQFGIDLPLL